MKSKPIGVRFDEDLLIELKELGAQSPQQALNFLCEFYRTHKPMKGEKQIPTPKPEKKAVKKQEPITDKSKEMPTELVTRDEFLKLHWSIQAEYKIKFKGQFKK